jgi:F-type H+-transporting ATPase subunit b
MLAAVYALAATGVDHAEKKVGLPQLHVPDFAPQLIWLALSFGVLYLILSRIALPRIGQVMEERAGRIQRDLRQAERLKRETEAAIAGYEDALAQARGKSSAIVKEVRQGLAAEVEQERARVDHQVADKLAQAEARIAQTKTQALSQVNQIARETAEAIVTKLIGKKVGADEVQRALEPVPGE